MLLRRKLTGAVIVLDEMMPLGRGGEANVYAVSGEANLAAKVYLDPEDAQARARKLAVMQAHPPEVPAIAEGHTPVAWPTDLLYHTPSSSDLAGFLMPRVEGARGIIDYYNPQTRLEQCPLFDYRYLLRTARNLAAVVRALHTRGYVIGDLKHSNVLVTETALVTLVDADSFAVRDPDTGEVFPCPVVTPDFTPPELQEKSPGEHSPHPEQDCFALAVLIFHLLMEGTHPFAGVYEGDDDPPPFEERIAKGHYPYGTLAVPYRPSTRSAPPFAIVPPPIQELFRRCFEDGYTDPTARPDAREWQAALDEVKKTLIVCTTNTRHWYGIHLDTCPWCARKAGVMRGIDPFPSDMEVRDRARRERPAPATQTPSYVAPPPAPAAPSPSADALKGMIKVWSGIIGVVIFGAWFSSLGAPHPQTYSEADETIPSSAPPYSSPSSDELKPTAEHSSPASIILADRSVAFSPDGKTLATSGTPVVLWDIASGNIRQRLQGIGSSASQVVFSPHGSTLAISGVGNAIFLWDAQGKSIKHQIATHVAPTALDFSPDGKLLVANILGRDAVSSSQEGQAQVWNVETGKPEFLVGSLSYSDDALVRFAPDNKTVALTSGQYIRIWDIATKSHKTLQTSGMFYNFAFSPDGKHLLIAGYPSSLNDLENFQQKLKSPALLDVTSSFQGQNMATLDTTGKVSILNGAAHPKLSFSLPNGNQALGRLALSPDGRLLAIYDWTGGISLWNTRTGKQVRYIKRPQEQSGVVPPASANLLFHAPARSR